MSDTWMKLSKEQTTRKRKFIDMENGDSYSETLQERCFLCYKTDCELVGLYGTWNAFGSFKGVCRECLSRLNKIAKEE